ncbi:hypothetical protein EON65_26030 [archaeon]|nr:MAG: hypothetical protein EON65_26030 [archaeon]
MSAEEKRNSKIEKYKRDKAAKLRMQVCKAYIKLIQCNPYHFNISICTQLIGADSVLSNH